MRLASADESATLGRSALHRADPIAKLIAFGMVLAAVVASANVLVVAAVALVLLAVVFVMRLPWRPMLVLAAYPAFFALLFAWAAAPDPLSGALIVAKALCAALAAVLLMFTTPYPQVFAPLQRVLPQVVGDAMLMTYRSFFILLEGFARLVLAARLRAGIVSGQPVRSAKAAARALGGLVLQTVDLSQRTWDVMRLRGYERRLIVEIPHGEARGVDAAVVCVSLALLAMSLAWRVFWPVLNPASWAPVAVALALLAGGVLVAATQPPGTGIAPRRSS
jgi:energy-coupling factor transporter transmembrane protein EcfT